MSAETYLESDRYASKVTFPLPVPKLIQFDCHPSINIFIVRLVSSYGPLAVGSGL